MWLRRPAGGLAILLTLLLPQQLGKEQQVPDNAVYYIVIHHAASGWPEDSADISAAAIDKMHKARGFDSIGYNYVVRFDGTVEKGRAEDIRGAHARAWDTRGVSYNASSIGVCFAGNCDLKPWTIPQQDRGYALILELMRRYNVPPERVIGHRECGMNTDCPGTLIDMDKVRARLRKMAAADPHARKL